MLININFPFTSPNVCHNSHYFIHFLEIWAYLISLFPVVIWTNVFPLLFFLFISLCFTSITVSDSTLSSIIIRCFRRDLTPGHTLFFLISEVGRHFETVEFVHDWWFHIGSVYVLVYVDEGFSGLPEGFQFRPPSLPTSGRWQG